MGARSREAAIHRRIDPEACVYQVRIGCHTSLSASHRRGDIGDSRSSRRHHTFNARSRLASRLRHFLRLKLTLRDTRPIGLLAYELASVLHGNSSRADFVDDIQDWGLVTEKKPIGVGTTFHYTVVRLTKLAKEIEERRLPIEGWIHLSVTGVHDKQ